MARGAAGGAEEQPAAPLGSRGQGNAVPDKCVIGAMEALEFKDLESGKRIGDLDDRDILRGVDMVEGRDEHRAVVGDGPYPFGQDRPGVVDAVVYSACHLIFPNISGHFELGGHRKEGLGSKDIVETLGQPFLGRAVEAVAVKVRDRQATVVKQDLDRIVPEIPEAWGVAGDAFADPVGAGAGGALRADADAALADAEGQPVGSGMVMVMARAAGDIPVSAQYLVVEQKLSDGGLFGVGGDEISGVNRVGPGRGLARPEGEKEDAQSMHSTCTGRMIHGVILAACLAVSSPGFAADLETARDLMEAGEFEAAREMLRPLANSGNADAEELIGVMYALGLGVERDDERAFDWYLRSSMKGHPGAQSGLGWYYEVGRGIPKPDLVRAYLWYALSAIGGDPDALISLEEITPRLTAEERARAERLVDDYRTWMYPFR